MQVRLKPCAKRGNINHRACTNEGCSLFLYRAQPVSEMERSGVELQGLSRRRGGAARERDGAKRSRAAGLEPKKRRRSRAYPLYMHPSPPISAVISSMRSSGNGGCESGFIAIDISFIGLSSAATLLELR